MITRPTDVRDPQFAQKLQIWYNQAHQDEANAKILTEWRVTADNWIQRNQQNQNLALPVEATLPIPLMTIYSDEGVASTHPFPGVFSPVLTPPAVVVPAHGIAADNPPADRTDAILLLLQMILSKLEGK